MIDMLVSEWRRTRPATPPDGMQVVGRTIRLGRSYEEQVTRLLRPYGLSYSDFDVLATLCRIGAPHEMSPTQLQRNVLLTSGAMTACLRRLEALGLIERRSAFADRRRLAARLTAAGVTMVEALIEARFALADDALTGLDGADVEYLGATLRDLGAAPIRLASGKYRDETAIDLCHRHRRRGVRSCGIIADRMPGPYDAG